MADESAANSSPPSFNLIGQYIRDMSFENPGAPASIMLAGSRWLKANGGGWTLEDRKRLANAYTLVNLAISAIAMAIMLAVANADPALGAQLGLPPQLFSIGPAGTAFVLGFGLLVAVGIAYGVARVVLGVLVNSQARATGPDGKLL